MNIDGFDFANEGMNIDTSMHVNELVTRLEQALINPVLQDEAFQQLYDRGILQRPQNESKLEKPHKEDLKRGHSSGYDDGTSPNDEGLSDDVHH